MTKASTGANRPLRSWLRWFGAVRVRACLVSVAIVGAAFVLAAFGVTSMLRGSLYQSATNTARAEALALASVITNHGQGRHHWLPISEEEMAAQVVGPSGTVYRSSRNVAGQPAMASLFPPPGASATATGVVLKVRRFTHVDLDLDERFVVVAEGFSGPPGPRAVLVAYSLGTADHAVGLVELAFAIAFPLLALLVGALVWSLTGWALRPVEAVRSEVARLSATDLRRRVPEPPAIDEVGRLARTMNEMLSRLEDASNRQRQLVADVSHELRNPLAALKAQLEVAAEHPSSDAGSLLAGSMAEVDRLIRLVEDLLTLARFDEGLVPIRLSDVDLDELVLAEAERLRQLGSVEVSVREVGAARTAGDEGQLARVVRNLADNACRHARSRVAFSVRTGPGYCELVVADDGPGVPPAERERVFQRFVRLDTARSHEGSGAGLGLAIVREIVRAHGGDVWVEGGSRATNEPKVDGFVGARFVVRLPHEDNLGWRGASQVSAVGALTTD
jgi:signal transduction histidine kinase